ncbi:MAG: hypothetical protein ACM3N3_19795 [Betaproteobacteria bacterium]
MKHLPSTTRIVLLSLFISLCVLAFALLAQWLVYHDWFHQSGPIRIVGTLLASILTFLFALRWLYAVRQGQLDMLRRFETIAQMTDRIRNAMQAIELVTFVSQPDAMGSVRDAVQVIDAVLREALEQTRSSAATAQQNQRPAVSSHTPVRRHSA